jgi:hypothetical protein
MGEVELYATVLSMCTGTLVSVITMISLLVNWWRKHR